MRGRSEDRCGRAVVPTARGKLLGSGSGKLRLGRFGRLGGGGKPAGRGMKPGSVLAVLKLVEAGFSGMTWLREEAADDGSSGTVGKPVCSSLGMQGAAVLIDRPVRESSRPEGTPARVGGGVTAESWTSVNPSFSGLTGSLGEFPGKLIFLPSSKGLVGILWRYP